MIVKITVNDNDFYYKMKSFMENMWNFHEDKTLSPSDQIEALRKHFDILKKVNPNNDKTLTVEEETDIIEYLKKQFSKYMERHCEEDTVEYLIRNVEIRIMKTFTDRWENGEAFYWLQHSNTVVNQ